MPTDCLQILQVRIAQSNQSAFADLYNRFKKRLTIFSHSLIHSREIAEEVVEDVFISIWINRQKMPSIQNLPVYLYVSTKNKSLNALAKKANDLITDPFDNLEIEISSKSLNPHELLVSAEMINRMNAAIETLPPRCKMIFKLVREDGLKYKDVAEILNISVNTIDTQMAIAIKRIVAALSIQRVQTSGHAALQAFKYLVP